MNVVDLFKLQPDTEHPHGLSDRDFRQLVHPGQAHYFQLPRLPLAGASVNLSPRKTTTISMCAAIRKKGNINTPLELAIQNQIDRYSIAMDVIDRVPSLKVAGAHAKEQFKNQQLECINYAHEYGIDMPDILNWKFPGAPAGTAPSHDDAPD